MVVVTKKTLEPADRQFEWAAADEELPPAGRAA
jgi:hypothetical protein